MKNLIIFARKRGGKTMADKLAAEIMDAYNNQGDWDKLKEAGIIDADFYLADLLSANNTTLKEKLFVLLKSDHYVLDRRVNDTGLENYTQAVFLDNQNAHTQFWNRYKRPPRRKYWDKMVERRDLLVPQDKLAWLQLLMTQLSLSSPCARKMTHPYIATTDRKHS